MKLKNLNQNYNKKTLVIEGFIRLMSQYVD